MTYSFLDFELDTEQQELRQAGVAVPLSPKPFSVLEYLIQNNNRMVPKSELTLPAQRCASSAMARSKAGSLAASKASAMPRVQMRRLRKPCP